MNARALLLLLLSLYTVTSASAADAVPHSRLFQYSREVLTRKPAREFLKLVFRKELAAPAPAGFIFPIKIQKDLSETQFMFLLDRNPALWSELDQYLKEAKGTTALTAEAAEAWRQKFRQRISNANLLEEFKRYGNPLEPYPLLTPDGKPGYDNLKLYVNHDRLRNSITVKPDNLKQVVLDFIRGAKQQLVMNVFDFDLMEVADALAAKAQEGVRVRVGIDKGVIEARAPVKAVYERLKAGGVAVRAVDSVGLNHQKIFAADWDMPGGGRVLLSSGNMTQSCIGPEGDLVNIDPRPAWSVPNANHMITLDSDLLAQLIHHELTKTLEMGLRGSDYPLNGAYQVFGPAGSDGKPKYLVISFTPGGGLKSVNQNMISRVIASTEGPIQMLQFAFSSKEVEAALLARAELEIARSGSFPFTFVGDTPFSMQDWSVALSMTALKLEKKGKARRYVEAVDSPWRRILGPAGLEDLRKRLRVAPRVYGLHRLQTPAGVYEANAKLHHKMLISGAVAILGTSFNFSEGAESNQEQIVIFRDPELAEEARGMAESLFKESPASVYEESIRRNRLGDTAPIPPSEVDKTVARDRAPAGKVISLSALK